jgi:iron only hydrogenase large subunit-like protein
MLLAIYLFTGKKQIKTVSTRIDTVLTTKTITKFIKGDKIRYKILDTINTENHDTTYIIKDYNQVKEFTDSIRQDSNLFVINDTISENRLI